VDLVPLDGPVVEEQHGLDDLVDQGVRGAVDLDGTVDWLRGACAAGAGGNLGDLVVLYCTAGWCTSDQLRCSLEERLSDQNQAVVDETF